MIRFYRDYIPVKLSEPTYFFFYDGSFLIFSYACASQFYDAFFFYHTAYFVNVFMNNYFFSSAILVSISCFISVLLTNGKSLVYHSIASFLFPVCSAISATRKIASILS